MKTIVPVAVDDDLFSCLNSLQDVLGISRVMLTGGEPLLHPDLLALIKGMRAEDVSITTNGTRLLSVPEWQRLKAAGLTKVAVSIHDGSPEGFLQIEAVPRTLAWATRAFEAQLSTLRHLAEAEVPTRVNCVVHNDMETALQVLNFLRPLQLAYRFEIRLLDELSSIEASQEAITCICAQLGARETHAYRRDGSSSTTVYYRANDGFAFSVKTALRHPFFFAPICGNCPIRNTCFEGFYGVRVERREGVYFVRLCIYKQTDEVLMPWQQFIGSGLAVKVRDSFILN